MKNYPNKNSFRGWLGRLSVQKKFSIITGLIIFILLFELGNFWLSMKIASGLRAYVGGESLWSKAQKAADNDLIKYTISFDESDYNNFLSLLQVPLGDKQARLELEKSNPDSQVVQQGFLQGGNNIADINDMTFLFRKFRHVSYMDQAIQIWTQGDQEIQQLIKVGQQIHSIALTPIDQNDPNARQQRAANLASLTTQVTNIDQDLTVLENNFSATLGQGSRSIRDILLWLTVILTIILGAFAIFVSELIRRIIVQVDRAKSEFVSLASHQLRTPLTVVKWQASRLLEELEKADGGINLATIKKYGKTISLNSQRMIELVNGILNVSKIDLGSLAIEPKPTVFTELIDRLLEELQPEIELKNLKVTKVYPAKLPKINIDPRLMRIVIQNLLTNSIKYTSPRGKISIKVEANPAYLILSVKDSGCGISQQDQNKIYDKFFRTEAARQIDPNGNGLGMYIVKAIVEEAKGKIWFNSKLGKGTTFYVQLPITGMGPKPGIKDLSESYS